MKRSVAFFLSATMSLLLWLYLAPNVFAAELLAPIVMRVPPGWQADKEGYFLNPAALQYLVADAESWEQTAGVWESAYNDLNERYQTYIRETKTRYLQLTSEIEREREQWRKKVRRERTSPGIGVFGGYGVSGWTVGVGLVWRVF